MQTLDLLRGTRTTRLDLSTLPFLSRLGPNEGAIDLVADPGGRLVNLHVSIRSSRRVLLRELERIAAEATWNVPVDRIRRTTTPHFVVDLELGPDGKQRLAQTEVRLEGVSLEGMRTLLRPLLKDKHYQVSNIREVHPTR